jgi:hypothetical protein
MNTRQIQPKNIWTPSGEKVAIYISLFNFSGYHFDNGSGVVDYKLIGMEGEPASAIDYFVGEVEIPTETIQNWGASDDIIFAYVANKLGLQYV